ncbi:MAG TPA: hypothetical protein DF383_10165 [Deltaproteobacteria bacterium]|nr:hypothetical protein [Deltaproteobacteria bacterium]
MKSNFETWRKAWEARRDYVRAAGLAAFRLVNDAADGLPGLAVDFYAGRYQLSATSEAWLQERANVESQLCRLHPEFGASVSPRFFWNANWPGCRQALNTAEPESFTVREGGLRFEVQLGKSLHTGLFLDQRENRSRLRKLAADSRGLNLFCHTGAFTVAALAGGAREVISVDLSKNYLGCLERNLRLNDLSASAHQSIAGDAMEYLRRSQRNKTSFDWIVLDPPTFSRGKQGTFSTENNYGELTEACLQVLAPQGRLLACLNTQSFSLVEFKERLKTVAKAMGRKILETPPPPPDFPSTPEAKLNPPLKCVWIGTN